MSTHVAPGDGRPGVALVVVDMLNPYEHADADALAESVAAKLPGMLRLRRQASREQWLTVYVNDNYGDWSAGRPELLERALSGRHPSLVEPLAPGRGEAFVTKARHSAFYETQLEYILRHEGVERVVLMGQVTEQCILYSALDAYVRHFSIVVPVDAVAHIHEDLASAALRMMERNMAAEMVPDGASVPRQSQTRPSPASDGQRLRTCEPGAEARAGAPDRDRRPAGRSG
jgi:nicotinamidase-related amidase